MSGTAAPQDDGNALDPEKGGRSGTPLDEDSGEKISSTAQIGVKKVEAATTVWTKWQLIAAYTM